MTKYRLANMEYDIPEIDEIPRLQYNPPLVAARLFAIGLFDRSYTELNPQERAFYLHIFEHPELYDIDLKISDDGLMRARIGSFNDHVENKPFIWLPFILIPVFMKFLDKYLNISSTVPDSLLVVGINYLILSIGVFGIFSYIWKLTFDKNNFKIWYTTILSICFLLALSTYYVN